MPGWHAPCLDSFWRFLNLDGTRGISLVAPREARASASMPPSYPTRSGEDSRNQTLGIEPKASSSHQAPTDAVCIDSLGGNPARLFTRTNTLYIPLGLVLRQVSY